MVENRHSKHDFRAHAQPCFLFQTSYVKSGASQEGMLDNCSARENLMHLNFKCINASKTYNPTSVA